METVLVYHDLFTVVYFLFVPAFKFHRTYLEKDTYFSCYCLFLGLKGSNHVAGCVFYTFFAILPSNRLVHSSNNWKDSLLSTTILFTPCLDTRQPGTVFKKLDTRQSEILTNFLEIARLIPLRTQDICLEISNDCKYCLGLKVEATVEHGQKIFKFWHTESPDWINSRWISTEIINATSPEYLVFV